MNKKKTIKYVILVIAILIVLIILLTSLGDIKKIANIFKTSVKWYYLLACLGAVLIYFFFVESSLDFLFKKKYKDISSFQIYNIAGSGLFFDAITPFSTGGQPFEAYALKRLNVKLSDSTSILLVNFLVYQIVLNVFTSILLIFYYPRIHEQVDNIVIFIIVGFSINFFIMALLILIGTTKFMGKAIIKLMDLLCKIKFLNKYLGKEKENFKQYVNDMQSAFKDMKNHLGVVALCTIIRSISLIIYYSIPFLAFLSIGINLGFDNFIYCIAVTSFSLTIAIWVPTPGSSGGAELAFTTLFVGLIDNESKDERQSLALSGMLVWRFFTYYLSIIYGFIRYLIFEKKMSKIEKNIDNKDKISLETDVKREENIDDDISI